MSPVNQLLERSQAGEQAAVPPQVDWRHAERDVTLLPIDQVVPGWFHNAPVADNYPASREADTPYDPVAAAEANDRSLAGQRAIARAYHADLVASLAGGRPTDTLRAKKVPRQIKKYQAWRRALAEQAVVQEYGPGVLTEGLNADYESSAEVASKKPAEEYLDVQPAPVAVASNNPNGGLTGFGFIGRPIDDGHPRVRVSRPSDQHAAESKSDTGTRHRRLRAFLGHIGTRVLK